MQLRKRLDLAARLGLNLAAYPIAKAARRSPRRWAFGHPGGLFAGNSKYLFLWITLHRPDIEATWITDSDETFRLLKQAGLPVALRWSRDGVKAALHSDVFAFTHDPADVNLTLSPGAMHLNLWHGVGLKALHTGHKLARWPVSRLRSFVYVPYDMVVSTSDMMQAHFAAQFRLPPECAPQLGYPRLDVSIDPALAERAREIDRLAGFAFNPDGHAEVYIYMPTFRDSGRPFFADAIPDPDRLAQVLKGRDALLYIKPHPRTTDAIPSGHPRIRRWPDAIDFHTYLPDFTGLITDYSSVLYDYLFVNRSGAILYTFDHDDYVGKDRTLLYGYDDNVAGQRATTFEELCDVLRASPAPDAGELAKIDEIRDRFWGGSHRPASPAIIDYVEGELAARERARATR